jgi:hypothetical protein
MGGESLEILVGNKLIRNLFTTICIVSWDYNKDYFVRAAMSCSEVATAPNTPPCIWIMLTAAA